MVRQEPQDYRDRERPSLSPGSVHPDLGRKDSTLELQQHFALRPGGASSEGHEEAATGNACRRVIQENLEAVQLPSCCDLCPYLCNGRGFD